MNGIITMPLNPRHAQKIGFYSLFAYAKYLGELHQLPTIFVLNEIGAKDNEQTRNTLSNKLISLGLEPSLFWSDNSVNERMLSRLIQKLQGSGKIDEVSCKVSHCECLKVQYITEALLRKTKTSLVTRDNKSLCCNTEITERSVRSLLTSPIEPPTEYPELYPTWAKKEFDWIYSELRGQKLLLSRIDDRRFLVATESGGEFWLDNDVVGMFIPGILREDDIGSEHLISGISTMRQAALMLMLSSWLGVIPPKKVHFLPRVDFSIKTESSPLESSVQKFGAQRVTNALLWCAMSERQTIVLDANMFSRMSEKELKPNNDRIQHRRNLVVR